MKSPTRGPDLRRPDGGFTGCNRVGATSSSPFPRVFAHDPA